jgi:N-acetylglucosaminyldiphosphoundecaprenol N-acetyl-beta-D-mannosaminyltransferase
MHRQRLKVPLCMGVGASLDFLAGEFSRAPIWIQTAGLEWLYRAAQEPRRLAQRYLVDAYGLARHLPAQVAANAIQPRRGRNPSVLTARQGNASIISISGNLTGPLVTEFEQQLGRAYQEDRHIVLDLAETTYFGLDSVGLLVHLAKKMYCRERQIWLTALPPHVVRVFRAARMNRYFGTTHTISDAIYRVRKSETRSASETIAVHTFANPARDMHVQEEMLKDLCRKIVFFSQTTRLATARPRTSSSATH